MKIILTILTIFILSISTSFAREGGSSGGGQTISLSLKSVSAHTNREFFIDQIHTIETVDRDILFNNELKKKFQSKNGKLIINEKMLNIETNKGELISL